MEILIVSRIGLCVGVIKMSFEHQQRWKAEVQAMDSMGYEWSVVHGTWIKKKGNDIFTDNVFNNFQIDW